MKILTVRQPHASLIVSGKKIFELRNWKPVTYRGPLLIHAAATRDLGVSDEKIKHWLDCVGDDLPTSEILGIVHLTDVRPASDFLPASPYKWAWVLKNARAFEKSIAYRKGTLRLADCPPDLRRMLLATPHVSGTQGA